MWRARLTQAAEQRCGCISSMFWCNRLRRRSCRPCGCCSMQLALCQLWRSQQRRPQCPHYAYREPYRSAVTLSASESRVRAVSASCHPYISIAVTEHHSVLFTRVTGGGRAFCRVEVAADFGSKLGPGLVWVEDMTKSHKKSQNSFIAGCDSHRWVPYRSDKAFPAPPSTVAPAAFWPAPAMTYRKAGEGQGHSDAPAWDKVSGSVLGLRHGQGGIPPVSGLQGLKTLASDAQT